jgi:hypothetical protein
MAQANRSSKSRSGAKRSSGAKGSSRSRAGATKAKTRPSGNSQSARSRSATSRARRDTPAESGAAARQAAAAGTRAAGKAVAAAARQARVPLLIGGATAAGAVGGLVVRARGHRSSARRGGGLSLLLQDGKLDLESVEGAAKRVSTLTEQLGEIIGTVRRSYERS